MRRTAILTLFLLPLQMLFAEQQITGTITEVMDANANHFVFLDINNTEYRQKAVSTLSATPDILCYRTHNYSPTSNSPILVKKRSNSIFNRSDAGRDFGIGAGLCAGSCLFVLAFGEEKSTENGVQKTVEGPLACIPAGMGIAGCVFLTKGVIDLFAEDKSASYGKADEKKAPANRTGIVRHLETSLSDIAFSASAPIPDQSTEAIVKAGNYTVIKKLEKTVSTGDFASMEKWVQRYCLSM